MAKKDTLSKYKAFKAKLNGEVIQKPTQIFTPANNVLTYEEILADVKKFLSK